MKNDFNPLDYRMPFEQPKRLSIQSQWNEHVPFAMTVIEALQPRLVVELGTQFGVSHCAWCQAAAALETGSRCYAVDTWAGDPHTGFYGTEVYDDLVAHHHEYESFSTLLRMTFDEALNQFSDGSIDLLHIDGLHTYEAVRHDFEAWLPKMSKAGVVLFHDTIEVEKEFGVYRLWDEITVGRRHFNFEHCHGLGVLLVGSEPPAAISGFFDAAEAHPAAMRSLFSSLGRRVQLELEGRERQRRDAARKAQRPTVLGDLKRVQSRLAFWLRVLTSRPR